MTWHIDGWTLVFGMCSTVLAVGFGYFGLQPRAKPSYATSSLALLEADEPMLPRSVGITFDGKHVQALVKTYVAMWNDGRKTISREDLAHNHTPRVMFSSETEILRIKVVRATRSVLGFTAGESLFPVIDDPANEKYQSGVALAFDFLDKDDGALIEILHTSPVAVPLVSGTVKGVRGGFISRGLIPAPHVFAEPGSRFLMRLLSRRGMRTLYQAMFFGGAITLLSSVGVGRGVLRVQGDGSPPPEWLWVVVSVPYLSFGGLMWWRTRRRVPRLLVPDPMELSG